MQLTLIADIKAVAIHRCQLPMGYEIRPLQENDLPELTELYLAAYSREIVKDLAAAKKEMQRTFAGEYGPLVAEFSPVAVTKDTVVGAVMTVAQTPWPDTPVGPFLIEIITDPHHRRRGLAKAGVVWVAKKAQKQGFATLALRVESENSGAVALYRELGFCDWLP